jgi:transcriptional regulator with XRE-family HTH domain
MRRRRSERAGQYEGATYKDLQHRLAANVRKLRDARGWSQEEAAHKSDMATRLLQRIESADVNMTLTTLSRLSEGFETDICQLFEATRPPRALSRTRSSVRSPPERPSDHRRTRG